jgi:glycerol-3-phosphate acyltransferase PlsY
MLLAWLVTFYTTRFVAVASIVAALLLPVAAWIQQDGFTPVVAFAMVLAALVIWRHRSNIQRLRDGTENKFTRKGKPPATANTSEEEGI